MDLQHYDVIDALTTDEHFQQAGFRALLREDMRVSIWPSSVKDCKRKREKIQNACVRNITFQMYG